MYILLVLYASGVYMKTQSAHFLCSHCKSSDINESSPTMLLEINLLFYIINYYYEIANQSRKENQAQVVLGNNQQNIITTMLSKEQKIERILLAT